MRRAGTPHLARARREARGTAARRAVGCALALGLIALASCGGDDEEPKQIGKVAAPGAGPAGGGTTATGPGTTGTSTTPSSRVRELAAQRDARRKRKVEQLEASEKRARRRSAARRVKRAATAAATVVKLVDLEGAKVRIDPGGHRVTVVVPRGRACGVKRSQEARIGSALRKLAPFVRAVRVTVAGAGSLDRYRRVDCKPKQPKGKGKSKKEEERKKGKLVYGRTGSGFLETTPFRIGSRRWTIEYATKGRFFRILVYKGDTLLGDPIGKPESGKGERTLRGPGSFRLRISASGSWSVHVREPKAEASANAASARGREAARAAARRRRRRPRGPVIRRIATVLKENLPFVLDGGEGHLQADDRYVLVASASGLTTLYDSVGRKPVTVTNTCGPEEGSPFGDVQGHRLLVAAQRSDCAPAVLDLDTEGGASRIDIKPSVTPTECFRRSDRSCEIGTVVESYQWLADDWVVGTFEVVGDPSPGIVARNLVTGERRELFRGREDDYLAIFDVAGDRLVFEVARPSGEPGSALLGVTRNLMDIDTGQTTPLSLQNAFFGLDFPHVLTAHFPRPKSFLLQSTAARAGSDARIKLRNTENVNAPFANAGGVTWGNDYTKRLRRRLPDGRRRSPTRRFDLHLYDKRKRALYGFVHRPKAPPGYDPPIATIATAHAIVWAISPAPELGIVAQTELYATDRPVTLPRPSGR